MKKSTKAISLIFLALLGLAFGSFAQVPTANFSWTPTTPCQNSTVQITDMSTGSPIVWVYGFTGSPTQTVAQQNPVVTFTASGVQTIVLVCANISGSSTPTTKTINIIPGPSMSVATTNTAACSGSSVLITASGANAYTWTPGGQTTATIAPSPTANTVYTVVGTNTMGCASSMTFAQNIATLTVSSSTAVLCSGSTATLTASGSNSYSWQPGGQTTATIAVTPTANTTYTVMNPTCSLTANFTQSVTTCVGIHENSAGPANLALYPNPASSNVNITVNGSIQSLEVYDLTGRVIYSSSAVNSDKMNIGLSAFSKGIYYIKVQTNNGTEIRKLIKE